MEVLDPNTQLENGQAKEENVKEDEEQELDDDGFPKRGFFDGFSWWKLAAAAAIGTGIGIGYSVLDQTILHKPKVSNLPYKSDILQKFMPDVVERVEKFFTHRRLVKTKMGKAEFDKFTQKMLEQSEYFATIYLKLQRLHAAEDEGGNISPAGLQEHFSLKQQARDHFLVIVQCLRTMCVLIGTYDNLSVENDFNQVYAAFNDRFYLIHQSVLG